MPDFQPLFTGCRELVSTALLSFPLCLSSEEQDLDFNHISPFYRQCHFWGTPESARMLHTCKTTSLRPSPSSKLLPCPGQPLFYNTRDKNREESPSHLAWAWPGTAGTGAASTVEKDQRRQGEKSQVLYTAL